MPENARPNSSLAAYVGQLRRIARTLARRKGAQDTVAEQAGMIERSGMFDREWYMRRYKDVATSGLDPIEHYVKHGAAEGRDPCATFNTAFYVKSNPDVAASGMNPLCHFIEFGQKEGRKSHPGQSLTRAGAPSQATRKPKPSKATDAEIIANSGIFDREFYVREYPSVTWASMDPVSHYIKHGARENRNPCTLFDTSYYLRTNPDVAASGMNPLRHFCEFGARELRSPSAQFDMSWYWLSYLAEKGNDKNPLAHYLVHGKDAALEVREVGHLSDVDKKALVSICERLLGREVQAAADATRIGMAMSRLSLWAEAEKAFRKAVTLDWNDPAAHERLANTLSRQGKWWQVVDSLAQAVALEPDRAPLHYRLGDAQERMNRFAPAADSYRRAIELDPNHAGWYYRLGYACEMSGSPKQAKEAYAQALSRDGRNDVTHFGVGMLHQLRGYWPEAADAYAEQLRESPVDAELHYRHGMAQDRCYRWDKAAEAYETAISLDPNVAYWHYRYGFVLERAARYAEAAVAYQAATALSSKHMPYWHYRQAYALDMAGEYEQACAAYLRTSTVDPEGQSALATYLAGFEKKRTAIGGSTPEDTSQEGSYYQLGEACEAAQDWNAAARAYADAVARSNPHRPAWYYRLGFVLYRAGRFMEACEAFRDTHEFRCPYGIDTNAYAKNPAVLFDMRYREYARTLPLRPDTILYESTHGASVGGNPCAIMRYLLKHPTYKDWMHVWVVNEDVVIPEYLSGRQNIVFVRSGSDLYGRYLATAGHLINDSTFPYWFSRRQEQKYLNTWHGTPLKTLGKHIRTDDEFLSHRNIQRNLLHATHLISPNPHTSDVLIDGFDVRGICQAKLAETGYPRIDRTLNASPERIAELRAQLGLQEGRPVALYAPTWRGVFGQIEVDLERLRDDLEKMVMLPYQWLFRGHPFCEELLRGAGLPVKIASTEFDTADLLAVADILVTDYSSICFDYTPTHKPIFYYCYDLAAYENSRGLYFDMSEMPGTVCKDITALIEAIERDFSDGGQRDTGYEAALAKFCPYEDGHAAARAVKFFIEGDDSQVVYRYQEYKPSLLFFGGHFAPNGINASFLNLLHALQELKKHNISIVVEPNRISSEPTWRDRFRELPGKVAVLNRAGRMVQDPEQAWVASKFSQRRAFASSEMMEVLKSAYQDEFRRCFGDARFDVVVDFDGYNGFWTTLFGLGAGSIRRVCWLHNDFYEEFILRYPNLKSQFETYPHFDALVSVSARLASVNQAKLARRFGIPGGKFKFCNNVINANELVELALKPVDRDLEQWLDGVRTFATLGRLSPEKDHAKLIDAFAQVHATHPQTRLVILGEGPLRPALEQQINQLGLHAAVFLAGLRRNPMPLLHSCDCFVLSSNHEGQPMVLLEAMVLKKAIVATDIDGNRGLLADHDYGLLVDNSSKGLAAGMVKFLDSSVESSKFSADYYNKNAIESAQNILIGANSGRRSRLEKRRNATISKSNRVVVADRGDGLGERLNAILNAMYLADRLGFDFCYMWRSLWAPHGTDDSLHAIGYEQDLFADIFISKYSVDNFRRKGYPEISGKNIGPKDLKTKLCDPEFNGWRAPRFDLRTMLSRELCPTENMNPGMYFRRIAFSDCINEAISAADSVTLPENAVGFHLRTGDIFFGVFRKWGKFSDKGITLPVAKEIIRRVHSQGGKAIIFGQDSQSIDYLREATGAYSLADLDCASYGAANAQAIFELVVMSRMKFIVAGSSGFARQASVIGNIEVKMPIDFMSKSEQVSITIEDLDKNAGTYHPLQTAMAYWHAYSCSAGSIQEHERLRYLDLASEFDPDNQFYVIKRAATLFALEDFDEGDGILRRVIMDEFSRVKGPDLPIFQVLIEKLNEQFNLVNEFKLIDRAAAHGAVYAALCKSVVKRASGDALGAQCEIDKILRSNDAVDDPTLNELCRCLIQ